MPVLRICLSRTKIGVPLLSTLTASAAAAAALPTAALAALKSLGAPLVERGDLLQFLPEGLRLLALRLALLECRRGRLQPHRLLGRGHRRRRRTAAKSAAARQSAAHPAAAVEAETLVLAHLRARHLGGQPVFEA